MLDLNTTRKIVQLVSEDISCRGRIEGPNFPASVRNALERWHWAGGVRNFTLLFLGGMAANDIEFVRVSCIGIAEITRLSIVAAIMKGKLPRVQNSLVAERVVGGFEHKATGVSMKDGKDYVFDWWPTLNPKNPLISTNADWHLGKGAVDYKNFRGFS